MLLPSDYRTRPPLLVVLSGPSGAGKDALLTRLREGGRPYHFVVTATTRPPRPGERDGVDYLFLSEEAFRDLLERGGFLEHARVYGHWYGVPREPVARALEEGRDVVLKVDVQGARTLKALAPEAVFIFLAPPTLEELERRLRRRKTEDPAALALRLATAREEMAHLPMFDYLVLNPDGGLDRAAAQVEAIITAEKCRVPPRRVRL